VTTIDESFSFVMSYHYQKNEPGGYEDAYDMVSFWVHSCCRGIVEREARKGKEALEGVAGGP
jgi:hypothetical protein